MERREAAPAAVTPRTLQRTRITQRWLCMYTSNYLYIFDLYLYIYTAIIVCFMYVNYLIHVHIHVCIYMLF